MRYINIHYFIIWNIQRGNLQNTFHTIEDYVNLSL